MATQELHQHGASSGHIPAQRAPWHWGHPRPEPSPSVAGVHHHGWPAHPSYPDRLQQPNQWLFKLCQEPDDDAGTCCEGFWFPYSLYGKIEYRMGQMAKQKDPLDESDYKCCNGPCWGLFFLDLCCSQWPAIMMNRTRVRSMFSIEGTVCEDFILAFFCGRCALMTQDREIRAREKYCCVVHNMEARQSFSVSRQPSLHTDMAAIPKDVHRRAKKSGKKLTEESQGFEFQSLKNARIRTISLRAGAEHDCLEEASSGNFTEGMEGTGSIVAPMKAIVRGDQPTHFTSKDRETIAARQPWRLASGKKRRNNSPGPTQGQENRVLFDPLQDQENAEASSSSHPLAECEKVENKDTNKSLANQHKLEDSEEVVVYYGDDVKGRPQRHRLADCARIRASTPGMADIPCWHTLSDDEMASGENSDPVEQHDLEDCHTTPGNTNALGDSFLAKPQHHLTDCLDKSEESTVMVKPELAQHIVADCIETVPQDKKKRVLFGNIEHVLIECDHDGGVLYEPDEDRKTQLIISILDPPLQLHVLDDCPADLREAEAKQERLAELHDLAACLPKIVSEQDLWTEQHHLGRCSPNITVGENQPLNVRHLVERAQIVPTSPLAETSDQRNFDNCPTEETPRESRYIRLTETEHSLIDCEVDSISVRDDSIRNSVEQHHLPSCDQIESSESEPQLKVPRQHPIEDCDVVEQAYIASPGSPSRIMHKLDSCDDTVSRSQASSVSTSYQKHSSRRRSSIAFTSSRGAPRYLETARSVSTGDFKGGSTKLHALLECEANGSSNNATLDRRGGRTTLISTSNVGTPAIPVTFPQYGTVESDIIGDDSTGKGEYSPCPITSGGQDAQHALSKCVTASATSGSDNNLNSTNSTTPPEQPDLGNCDITDSASMPSAQKQHVLADCDDEPVSSAEQNDGPSINPSSIPPPPSTPSTPQAFSPQLESRTLSGAALRNILGNLGGEPLDGSSDMIDGPEVAFDIGIAAPAPSVSISGNLRTKSRSRNRNKNQKNRAMSRLDKGKMSSSGAA